VLWDCIAAEKRRGNDGCAERENELAFCLCMHVEAIIPGNQISEPMFLVTSGET